MEILSIAETLVVILTLYVLFQHVRNNFKMAYYKKTLEINEINDRVKNMSFWKTWLN